MTEASQHPDESSEDPLNINGKSNADQAVILRRLYEALLAANRAVVQSADIDTLYASICKICVDFGFKLVWVGLRKGDRVVPVAMAGEATDYLDGIYISAREGDPEANGPSGTAVRTGRTCISTNFLTEEKTSPWHERAKLFGIASSASCPLVELGRIVGVLTFYTENSGFFVSDVLALIEQFALTVSIALDRLATEKRAEDQRRVSEANLRSIMDNLPYMTWLKDPDGQYLAINQTYANLIGQGDIGKIIGKTDLDLYPQALAEKYRSDDAAVIATRRSLHIEEETVYFNDRATWVETFKTPIIDDLGKVLGTVGCAFDISERKQASAALHQSQELLRLFTEHAPAALAMFDRNMRYLATSSRWREDYFPAGFDPTDLSHYDLCPEIPDRWKDAHRRGLAGEVIREDEDSFQKLNGSFQWLRWEIRPWYSGDGLIGGIVIFTEDISKYKQAENDRRMAENANFLRQLSVAASIAQEQERQEIAANLHDDLGQTLNILKLKFDALFKLAAKTPAVVKCAQDIDRLLKNASRSVRTLTTKLSPPILMELGFVPALSWMADELEQDLGLSVTILDDDTPKPLSPPISAILFRIVRELCINVAKHAQVKNARITVTQNDGTMRISVFDDGIGMGDWKANLRNKKSFGLAQVNERLSAINGTMEIQAPETGGTLIVLEIPLETPPNEFDKELL